MLGLGLRVDVGVGVDSWVNNGIGDGVGAGYRGWGGGGLSGLRWGRVIGVEVGMAVAVRVGLELDESSVQVGMHGAGWDARVAARSSGRALLPGCALQADSVPPQVGSSTRSGCTTPAWTPSTVFLSPPSSTNSSCASTGGCLRKSPVWTTLGK